MEFTGYGLGETISLCSQNSGRIQGAPENYGTLLPGAPANLIVFEYEPGMDRLIILQTICCGHEVDISNSESKER
jgi:N-acetylglucosamine-6-phosphate deacetylase